MKQVVNNTLISVTTTTSMAGQILTYVRVHLKAYLVAKSIAAMDSSVGDFVAPIVIKINHSFFVLEMRDLVFHFIFLKTSITEENMKTDDKITNFFYKTITAHEIKRSFR